MPKQIRRVKHRHNFSYAFVQETRCSARTDYMKYHPLQHGKTRRNDQCVARTINECGFCDRHCKLVCPMHGGRLLRFNRRRR